MSASGSAEPSIMATPPGMGIEPDRTEPACIGRYHPSCEARPIQAVIQAVGTIQAVSCCVCAAACGQMFRVRRLTRANTRYGAPSPLCPLLGASACVSEVAAG